MFPGNISQTHSRLVNCCEEVYLYRHSSSSLLTRINILELIVWNVMWKTSHFALWLKLIWKLLYNIVLLQDITRQNAESYLIFICQMGLFICPFSHFLQIFRELNNWDSACSIQYWLDNENKHSPPLISPLPTVVSSCSEAFSSTLSVISFNSCPSIARRFLLSSDWAFLSFLVKNTQRMWT